MDSAHERKRSFETALKEEFKDDRQTKRPRLVEEDFQFDQNVSETDSQPVLPGSVSATQLEHADPVLSSAPPTINDISEKVKDPVNDQTSSLIGMPFDSPRPRAAEDNETVKPTFSSQVKGLVSTPTPNARDISIATTADRTNHKPAYSSSEMPPSSFFTVQEQTEQVEESSDTGLPRKGVHSQTDTWGHSNRPDAPELDETIEAAVQLREPPAAPPQAVSELRDDGQIRIEFLPATPKPAFQLSSQVSQKEATATPTKSALPSSPLSTMTSSPFGSPESIPKGTNPFSGVNIQRPSASIHETSPPEAPQGDIEPVKSVQSSEVPARSKKENIHPQQTAEISDSGPRLHEASSNLSKSSPNHPSVSSQYRSAKKIRTPFRSPLLNRTLGSKQQEPDGEGRTILPAKSSLSSTLQFASGSSGLKKRGALSRIKGTGTSAARAAFKSPLRAGSSGTAGAPKLTLDVFSSSHKGISRNDPVKNRLQLLRRAMKIKESGEDEKLETLVGKWRGVAKEVAWELWEVVKEGNFGEGIDCRVSAGLGAGGGFGPFGSGNGEDSQQKDWGWAAGSEEDATEGPNKGKAKEDEDDDGPRVEERSMGAMLRQLGIAQETLAWDEEEGDFIEITG